MNWEPIKIAYDVINPTTQLDEKQAPIILAHGMTRCKEDWERIDQPLADATHRRVYKLDARNHGDSDRSVEFDFKILAKDINHFMELHKIQRALLIGHSMGGRTIMQVAADYPEKVEKIIVEDMSTEAINTDFMLLMCKLLAFKNKSLEIIPKDMELPEAKNFIKEILLEKTLGFHQGAINERTPENIKIEMDLGKNEKGFHWKTNYDLLSKEDVLLGLASKALDGVVSTNTLFLCGPKSHLQVMKDKDLILKKIPKASFKDIADATHSVHREYPEEFVKHCIDFIQAS